MPEREDLLRSEVPLWQRALSAVGVPFQWIHRNIEQPFAAAVTSPWTPSIEGTEGMGWWERERAEYEAAQLPSVGLGFDMPEWLGGEEATLGVKGGLEMLPWLLPSIASGGTAGLAGVAGRAGLKTAARGLAGVSKGARLVEKGIALPFKPAEKAIGFAARPITKPLREAAKKLIPDESAYLTKILPDLQPIDEAITIATQPSVMRNFMNMSIGGKQPLKSIAKAIAGRGATASNTADLSLVGRDILMFEGAGKALNAIATLNRLGTTKKLFNLTDDGFALIGKEQVHLNTVRTYPKRYWDKLSEPQKAWIDQAALLEKEKRELFERYGIKINDLTFEEGGVYAGRRVLGKFDSEGNIIDTAYIGTSQPGRPGAKTASEKIRHYETTEEAVKDGFRYLSEEEALYYNMVGMYNRVADKQFTDWFLKKVPWRTTRKPKFGEVSAPDIPAFAGKVFTSKEAKEYINILRKELGTEANAALAAINQVNAVGRYFALAGDVSPFGIQLIFLAGAHPKAFGKAMGGFVRAFFDPLYHDNLISKNLPLLQRHPGLISTRSGATEMTEAMAKGGLLRKQPFKVAGKVLEPFQRGFEAAIDTAGIEMAAALEHLGTTPARMAMVDAFINEFRGLANTKRIGISSSQRQVERALILAPQYNRAIGALMFDIAQGNLRGELARKSVAKGIGAIMAMTVAVSYAMGESEEEIVEHLNPLSTNFLTWDIHGQRIGPGSKVRSLLYTFGKMVKSPEDTSYHANRFLRGNFSPFVGTSMDIISGKNYMGDPTRDGLPNLSKTLLAENLLPIWLQSIALEGGDLAGRVSRGIAEFGGMRAYPAGAYMEVQDLQDKLAQEKHGVSWEELGRQPEGMVDQMKINRESPELQELTEKAAKESEKFARGEQLVWNEYAKQTDYIGGVVNTELEQASKQFEATGDGSKLRERVNQAYWMKSKMMANLLEREEFALVKETFQRPLTEEDRAEIPEQKLLYRDYNESMYSPDMFDEFGEYKFEEADRRRELFAQQYGIEAVNSVEAVIGERRADEPDAVKVLRQARKVLAPYWAIENQVWSHYPPQVRELSEEIKGIEQLDPEKGRRISKRYPMILRARAVIAEYKKRMRERNPEIMQAYRIFYR